ncbi:hypothetical protein BN946_scf185015.g23 [Trametes cinnabarina]|uniref:Uncharacterized protein n=1 Tax=Pycnoporus cinnabarinus TaxID=5643 RepID=A0A060SH20_PYCCI|nr:hypothetical protein BN946_scf185015.g23 [Trametes cinnabarina]
MSITSTTPQSDATSAATTYYGPAELAGVTALVVAGAISGVAVLPVLVAARWRSDNLRNTRILPFLVSLLLANMIQAIATLMNSRWARERIVVDGPFCRAQGGIKQTGNVATAIWSFTLSLHVFILLFFRASVSRTLCWALLSFGWFWVFFIVVIGPTAIESPAKGPYFGPTGYWCWITEHYPREQFFLEYFFEFLSAGSSFVLYTAVLLRVRGNLVRTSEKWHLRFVPHGERWKLAIRRDAIDGYMMRVAARIVWYPVAYAIILLPVTITRFVAFSGHAVPFRATIFADFVFNLQGVVNVALLLTTNRFVPDTGVLPIYTPRKHVSMSSPEALGITPFLLPPPKALSMNCAPGALAPAPPQLEIHNAEADDTSSAGRPASCASFNSMDSRTPLVRTA